LSPDKEEAKAQAISCVKLFLEQFPKLKSINEIRFTLMLEGVKKPYTGVIDEVYITDDGQVGIAEHKTTSVADSLINQMNYIKQVQLEAYALYLVTGIKAVEYRYRIIKKLRIRQKESENTAEFMQRYATTLMLNAEENAIEIVKQYN
jgi:hypothetical protein